MYQKAWQLITRSHYITLISHVNPDGDALGSSLSLYPILKDMGKKVSIVNVTTPLPIRYDFLPNYDKIKNTLPSRVDLLISFDCGSYDRLGIAPLDVPLINIDHHITNTRYGTLNLIDAHEPSASSVVLKLLHENAIPLRRDVATCIYAALAEDTGFFSYENVTAHAFGIAAELIRAKADPVTIAKNLKERNSLAKLRLEALTIDKLHLIYHAMVGYAVLTLEDFAATGALRSDSDACVDIIRSLATVELAILLIEEHDGFKVSLRSKGEVDVSQIALSLGGGGHKRAAGFTVKSKNREEIIEKIMEKAGIEAYE
ncbi:MAG TPA: bifunctional oligoribonuclease/PAP phosphatase NrnA [Campylobacteraceae bacterium]|nr:bifunctional oligoribonuclease/PAP phosphatase NrnA [Campylobacteraceae bacterium]HHD84227.1 bifunctional oligoribonuclease/PAP phosphatase NrnA [Campylobacteraceae bacterium]